MSFTTSTSSVSHIPLERCFENLKQSILQVVHHEQVSDEVRSFLAALVEEVLHRAEQMEDSSSGSWSGASGVRQTSSGIDSWLRNQAVSDSIQGHPIRPDLQDQGGPYQIEIIPRTGAIRVTNSETGKTLTFLQEDLIQWAEQQGVGRL